MATMQLSWAFRRRGHYHRQKQGLGDTSLRHIAAGPFVAAAFISIKLSLPGSRVGLEKICLPLPLLFASSCPGAKWDLSGPNADMFASDLVNRVLLA